MTKRIIIFLSLSLALLLSGCGAKRSYTIDPYNIQAASTTEIIEFQVIPSEAENASSHEGFTFNYNNIPIKLHAPAAPIIDALGEPKTYTEQPSCAFDGLDKTFYYGSFYMDTYPLEGSDYVYRVWFADDTVSTEEGIYIGASQAEVEAAYGADAFDGENSFAVTWEDTSLSRRFDSSHIDQFRMVRLTKAGLYLLTSTPDLETEKQRLESIGEASDRKIKELTYRADSFYSRQLREQWYIAAANPHALKVDRAVLEDAFLEAVYEGDMTILAGGAGYADRVMIINKNSNGRQMYRDWRLSNINALFTANDFLTCMDRRPMKTNWMKNDAKGREAFEEKCEERTLELPDFVSHVLAEWYENHPRSYKFADPERTLDEEGGAVWNSTPAFYSATEIPGFFNEENTFSAISLTGAKNVLRHTFSGVAMGTKKTYIVYHTRPKKTPWIERVEKTTADVVYKALADAKLPNFEARESEISAAIMVCASVHQFAKLFENAKKNNSKKWRKVTRVGVPYDSISIVPINASGAMQLRGLMYMTPSDYELYIMRNLQEQDPRFERTQEVLYQLTFNGIPVLLAHSMDFQRLYWALEDYYAGLKFYVSCFPGQVKFIKKIMPKVEFL